MKPSSATAQNTASEAMTLADSPEAGHGEAADSPIAVPKVSSTKDSAAASTAPAKTAPHSTKLAPAASVFAATGVPTCVMTLLSSNATRARSGST